MDAYRMRDRDFSRPQSDVRVSVDTLLYLGVDGKPKGVRRQSHVVKPDLLDAEGALTR